MDRLLLVLAALYFSTNATLIRYSKVPPTLCFVVFATVIGFCTSLLQLGKRLRVWDRAVSDDRRDELPATDFLLLGLLFFIGKVAATVAFKEGAVSTIAPMYFAWAPLTFFFKTGLDWLQKKQAKLSIVTTVANCFSLLGIGAMVFSETQRPPLRSVVLIGVAALATALRLVTVKDTMESATPEDIILAQTWLSSVVGCLWLLFGEISLRPQGLELWVPYTFGTMITYYAFYDSFSSLPVGQSTAIAIVELLAAAALGMLAGEWRNSRMFVKGLGLLLISAGFIGGVSD